MTTLKIYYPEGCGVYTDSIDEADIASQIAGNDSYADEARLLSEFKSAWEIPTTLGNGRWRKVDESETADGIPFVVYELTED